MDLVHTGLGRQQPGTGPRGRVVFPNLDARKSPACTPGARREAQKSGPSKGVYQLRPKGGGGAKEEKWAEEWYERFIAGQRTSGRTRKEALSRQLRLLVEEAFPEKLMLAVSTGVSRPSIHAVAASHIPPT